jgi:Fe-S-cluster containining protein
MEKDSIFLTSEQALKAVCLDFHSYGPQPMLFCELLRTLYGDAVVYKRDAKKEGLWVAKQHHRNMRWLEGAELIDLMCQAISEVPKDETDQLAAVCRLVFQTACRAEESPNNGCKGIRIWTGMESFTCRQCGQCCRQLAYHDGLTEEDVQLLRSKGREDVLEWVRTITGLDGQTTHRIWVTPGSTQFAVPCPFLKQGSSSDRWVCAIHDIKPKICQHYPVSRKHALMTGCPGFDTSKADKGQLWKWTT